MKTFTFKTNINCGSCINAVTPSLNGESRIKHWEVDVTDPKKVLTVNGELEAQEIVSLVDQAGFDAELIAEAAMA